MNYEKKRYKLINHDANTFIWLGGKGKPPIPKNWDASERTLKRSTKTFGVYTELSKDLVFVKEGANFLRDAYNFKEIEANVTMEEYGFHPQTEKMYLHSTGVFDFSQYKSNKLEVKVPFKSGGLNALIESQLKEKFEIERTTAINGNTINDIDKKLVALTSRKILLVSKFRESDLENEKTVIINSDRPGEGDFRHRNPLPLDIVSNSDQENISRPTPLSSYSIESFTGNGTSAEMFYLKSDVSKNVKIDVNVSFKIGAETNWIADVTNRDLYISLKRFNNGDSLDFVEDVEVFIDIEDFTNYKGQTFTYSGSITLDIEADESFALVAEMQGDYGDETGFNIERMWTTLEDINCTLTITEESEREDSQSYAVLMHDAFDKVMQIITGEQNRFYSEFYGLQSLGYSQDGGFARTGLSLGFWIRQFFDKNMEISLDNLLNTSNVIHNTGYHIETVNGVEKLIVEDLKFYFQNATAIVLPNQVTNIEREADDSFYDSSLEFGYDDNGEYEEAMGLDEYNIKTGFTTPLTRIDTKYSKISKAKAGSYPKEFARRKPQENYPTTDTPYDKWLFLLDLKTGLGNALEERLWQDDFEQEPTGVFSPETATNLRLTPSQIEQRHRWFYGCGLTKQQDKKIRYSNTGGNNNLSTKKAGESARSEKDDINISDLERPRFVPQKITFEHPVDYFVNEQLNGKTKVNGRLIPNVYFKVEFTNEYGQKEYGYLLEVKPNNEGKWTLLKAN